MHLRQLALMWDGGGLPAMVVTRHDQHTAIGMSPCEIAMLERVAGTINPRSLAVPDGKYAILISLRYRRQHLGAPHRGRGTVFVHAGLEQDVRAEERRGGKEGVSTCRSRWWPK